MEQTNNVENIIVCNVNNDVGKIRENEFSGPMVTAAALAHWKPRQTRDRAVDEIDNALSVQRALLQEIIRNCFQVRGGECRPAQLYAGVLSVL